MGKQLDAQALADFTRRWFELWTDADRRSRSSWSPICGRPTAPTTNAHAYDGIKGFRIKSPG